METADQLNRKNIALGIYENCYGTEYYYQYSFWGRKIFNYTDGVKLIAEKLQAYWLLDIVGSVCVYTLKKMSDDLLLVTLTVADNETAVFKVENDTQALYTQQIEYTDFPAGKWKFYLQNGVFFLNSEY